MSKSKGRETTRIVIRDLRMMAEIGVYPAERGVKQPVVVNVVADIAAPQDAPVDFYVCYHTLAKNVQALAGAGHINLVEDLAEGIARIALATTGVIGVHVRVEKTAALPDAAGVGVEIYRTL
ncbi:MAG: dihydroneopterin aldolase [Rhodospirillales bacterium]|nr:dihydroneopterin aldolase [Rhodospirillales bacterium]USO07782.1 MAG: dihydroneopterin aldolase [Rhodospirillales bacterium]